MRNPSSIGATYRMLRSSLGAVFGSIELFCRGRRSFSNSIRNSFLSDDSHSVPMSGVSLVVPWNHGMVASWMLIHILLPYQVLLQGRQKENKELTKPFVCQQQPLASSMVLAWLCNNKKQGDESRNLKKRLVYRKIKKLHNNWEKQTVHQVTNLLV